MRFPFVLLMSMFFLSVSASDKEKIYDKIVSGDSVISLSDLDKSVFNGKKIIEFFQTERKKHLEVLEDCFIEYDSIFVFESFYVHDYAELTSYHVSVIDIKKDSIYETKFDSSNNGIVVSQKKKEKFQIYNKKQEISVPVIYSYICDVFVNSKDSIMKIQNDSYDSTTSLSFYSLCTFMTNSNRKSQIFRFGFWPLWVKGILSYQKLKTLYP